MLQSLENCVQTWENSLRIDSRNDSNEVLSRNLRSIMALQLTQSTDTDYQLLAGTANQTTTDADGRVIKGLSRKGSVLLMAGAKAADSINKDDDKHSQERIDDLKSRRNKTCSLFFIFLGTGCTVFSIFAQINSNISIDPSYELLLLALSVCIVITAVWKLMQLMFIHICCSTAQSLKCCRLILVPGWAIWFLAMSLSLSVLCVFGFITYASDISYPFGFSLAFGILSFFFFIASTFGLYRYCGCCRMFLSIWQYISFYVCIGFVLWDIVSDILAAVCQSPICII